MAKRNTSKYSDEEKIEVVKLVEVNDFNYAKTSRDTGIHHATIHKWGKLFGPMVWNRDRKEEIIQKIEDKLAQRKEDFINKTFDLKIKFVEKLEDMLEDETNMDNVTKALKLLNEISDPQSDMDKAIKSGGNFFQLVNNQMINNGSKNITAGGDQ